jgi:hypothetical protein
MSRFKRLTCAILACFTLAGGFAAAVAPTASGKKCENQSAKHNFGGEGDTC